MYGYNQHENMHNHMLKLIKYLSTEYYKIGATALIDEYNTNSFLAFIIMACAFYTLSNSYVIVFEILLTNHH